MQTKSLFLNVLLLSFVILSCTRFTSHETVKLRLTNPSCVALTDYTFEISLNTSVLGRFDSLAGLQVISGKKILQSQHIGPKQNYPFDRIFLHTNIPANSSIDITLRPGVAGQKPSFPKKTLAEIWYKTGGHWENNKYIGGEFQPFASLRVPDQCTDHSYYIKYEGPGWESDKIGYRLYLDWRNAIDIYGKKTTEIVLPGVGIDGYESYHEMADWGMDILKVGTSLGIGSLGFWNGTSAERVAVTDSIYCEIASDGYLFSEVLINYYGWKVDNRSTDVKTSLSIAAGSRATHYKIELSNPIGNLCTGIVKAEETVFFSGDSTLLWNYIATWGKQSLAGNNLGMAVIFRQDALQMITDDPNSHIVVLSPDLKTEYYFLAAWEQEPGGITNLDDFVAYLNGYIETLNSPVTYVLVSK